MTLPPLPELKPCPFCEGEKHFKSSNGVESNYVVCAGCGAEGPAAETTAAAHAAWNRRAALAQPPAPTAQPAADDRLRMSLRADLAIESLAVDDLLRAMGEDPERYRTDGGAVRAHERAREQVLAELAASPNTGEAK